MDMKSYRLIWILVNTAFYFTYIESRTASIPLALLYDNQQKYISLMPFIFEGHEEIGLQYELNTAPRHPIHLLVFPLETDWHPRLDLEHISTKECSILQQDTLRIVEIVKAGQKIVGMGRFTSTYPMHLVVTYSLHCSFPNASEGQSLVHPHSSAHDSLTWQGIPRLTVTLLNGASQLSADESLLPTFHAVFTLVYLLLLAWRILQYCQSSALTPQHWRRVQLVSLITLLTLIVSHSLLWIHWSRYTDDGGGHPRLEFMAECCSSSSHFALLFLVALWTLHSSYAVRCLTFYAIIFSFHVVTNLALYEHVFQHPLSDSQMIRSYYGGFLVNIHRPGEGEVEDSPILHLLGWVSILLRYAVAMVFGLHLYRLSYKGKHAGEASRQDCAILFMILVFTFTSYPLAGVLAALVSDFTRYQVVTCMTNCIQLLAAYSLGQCFQLRKPEALLSSRDSLC